jgi:hypothetical protein
MLTKDELIELVMRSWCDEEGDLNLRLEDNLDDGWYITEEEVRSYLKDMAYDKGADSDYSQGFVDAVGTAVRSIFHVSPSDLLDDSEEADMTDDELTEHFDREDDDSTEREIVEEGEEEEAKFEVGDVVRSDYERDCFFITDIKKDTPIPRYLIAGEGLKNGAYWTLNSEERLEKVGHFQPTDEFFERVPEECNGSLVIDDDAGVLFDTMCRKHDFPYDCRQAVIGPEGDRYSVAGAKATGIVLSVSDLESVFCEEE